MHMTPSRNMPHNTIAVLSLALSIVLTSGFASAADKDGLPMVDMAAPQLDMDDPGRSVAPAVTPSSDEPLKAKAVIVDINSNTFNYDNKRDVYVATGQVHVVISEQNSELFADKVTYDQDHELIVAEGHVVIIKNGQRTDGTYAKIDLTRKSALVNDMETQVDAVRVKAKEALVSNDYLQFENGRLLVSRQSLSQSLSKGNQGGNSRGNGVRVKKSYYDENPGDDHNLANIPNELVNGERRNGANGGQAVQYADEPLYLGDGGASSSGGEDERGDGWFKLQARDIDVHRWEDGFTKIDMTRPKVRLFDKFDIPLVATSQAAFDSNTTEVQYLGPDIGYDPDLGGFFGGPGWDFRLGKGTMRFSPIASFGGGGRRRRGGSRYERLGVGPGVGGVMHYRDNETIIDASYNSRVGQPIGYFERKLFDGKTRFISSINEDYTAGFINYERPGYGAMINDTRTLKEFGSFALDSYASAGYFKDEFFPNNVANDFVERDADYTTPGTAGRGQLQFQMRNTAPLLSVGDFMDFGFRAQAGGAGYTTGDFAGILRGGPTMNVKLGDRFTTNLRYFFAQEVGDTPFVFDDYYQGKQSIRLSTAYRVNRFVTVGTRSNISLLKDNARGDLLTQNALFLLVGPRDIKLNVAYDVIRQRSYFGFNFYPGSRDRTVDFDTMRVFQPAAYAPSALGDGP